MVGRLLDRTPKDCTVASGERGFELLDASTVAGERRDEGFRVLDEDLEPDRRVRPGDARQVAKRAAGRLERIVPRRYGRHPPGSRAGLRADREESLLRFLEHTNHGPLSHEGLEKIVQTLLEVTKRELTG